VLNRLLGALAVWVTAHPKRVALLVLLPAILLGLDALRHPVDLAFTGIVPREHPLMVRYNQTSKEVNFGGRMPVLLEGAEEDLDAAVDAVVQSLVAMNEVVEVTGELPVAWLTEQAPYLVERPLFDAWLKLATDPSDSENAQELAVGLQALQAEVTERSSAQEGTRLLIVQMTEDPMAIDLGDPAYFAVERALEAAVAPFDVVGTAAGISAIAAQDQVRTLGRVSWLSPFSLLLVLLILTRVERRPLWLLSLAVPMLLSLAMTLGLVGEILGLITIMEAFFGVMVFGLGVDFGLHLLIRVREERAAGHSLDEAMQITWTGTGRGVVTGGLTTAGAFAVVAIAPDPGLRHLGASGAIGLLSCLILMLTLLPAMWGWLDRRQDPAPAPPPLEVPGLRALAADAVKHPWRHLGVAGVVLAVAIAGLPRATIETDLARIFAREVPALDALHKIQDIYGVNTGPWISVARTVEEARTLTQAYEAAPIFETVFSVASVLKADAVERHEALQAAAESIRVRKLSLQALVPIAFVRRTELLGAIGLLEALDASRIQGPPQLDELPQALRSFLVTASGRLLVYAYPGQSSLDGLVARTERLAAEEIDPEVAGFGMLLELMTVRDDPWVVPVFAGVLAFVGLVLVVDLRRPRWILLALTPVCVGSVVTFGVLCWTGVAFTPLIISILPLIIGLGVDDGIHVVHRMLENPSASPDLAAGSVGQAITMTTLTTCASFSVLMFADHPGMEGMAKVMLIGLPACLVASVSLVPALAVILGVRKG
jgi:predicted RND superfamily exporter protein